MGVLAGIAGPRIGSGIRGAQVKTSVRRFAAALRAARTHAVTHRSMIVAVTELGTNNCEFRVKRFQTKPRESFSGNVDYSGAAGGNQGSDIPAVFREPLKLEGDVMFLDFRFAHDAIRFNRGAVMFLPEGNSTGGIFVLGLENGPFYEVSVDPVTGRVHMDLAE